MGFTKKELGHLVIGTIFIALAFGFNDKSPSFELSYWLSNFFKILVIVFLSLLISEYCRKRVARRHGLFTEYRLWGIKRFSFKRPSFPKTYDFFNKKITIDAFPIGILISLFVMLLTNGNWFFVAIGSYTLMLRRISFFGKKYISITDYEEAKIALTGPLTCVFIAIVFKMMNSSGAFDNIILINSMIALFHMLPLPGLDGFKILLGSVPLYVFSMAFVVFVTILVQLLGFIPSLILSLVLAIIFGMFFFYFRIYKT